MYFSQFITVGFFFSLAYLSRMGVGSDVGEIMEAVTGK